MGSIKKNKSSIFIIPMIIGIPYKYFSGFTNCYIGCNHIEENDRRIYLVFETDKLKDESESVLKNNSQYVDELIINEFTVLTYRILKIFRHDFDMFKEGRYTEFSDRYKSILKKIYPNTKKLHSAINPSNKDREKLFERIGKTLNDDCEIYNIIEESEETFTVAHFMEVEV